jgi:hypothetical protein
MGGVRGPCCSRGWGAALYQSEEAGIEHGFSELHGSFFVFPFCRFDVNGCNSWPMPGKDKKDEAVKIRVPLLKP